MCESDVRHKKNSRRLADYFTENHQRESTFLRIFKLEWLGSDPYFFFMDLCPLSLLGHCTKQKLWIPCPAKFTLDMLTFSPYSPLFVIFLKQFHT